MLPKIIYFLILLNLAAGDQNITVDDSDPTITYTGQWAPGGLASISYQDGNHDSTTGTASFTFTGIAIYYYSLLCGSTVCSTNITLDSNSAVLVNLTSPNSTNIATAVRWSAEGLTNTSHTLVLRPGIPNSHIIVDEFMYTVPSSSISPTKRNKIIAGSVVGGVAAIAGAIIAAILAHKLAYAMNALLFSLFGIFLFRARRLIFKVDDHLENTEISLFLSEHENWEDVVRSTSDKPIVWKVFRIGGAKEKFDVSIPCESTSGAQVLGYGTIDDSGEQVVCSIAEKSPALYSIDDGIPTWAKDTRPSLKGRTSAQYVEELEAFALGTYDENRDNPLEPILLVDATGKSGKHTHPTSLFLHMFRSHGYHPGQYKNVLEGLEGDSLFPNGKGLPVSRIKPLTTWIIKRLQNGNLGVTVGKNDPKDVKQYEHDFKLHKGAKRDGSSV